MKLGVVVVTHGQLATELVNSAEMIVGDLPHFAAVSLGWHDDVDHQREEIGRAIERVQNAAGDGAGVLVLTDMFGGTPANLAVTFVSPRIEVVTGVNLPMLMKIARPGREELELLPMAQELREAGRNAIWVASELLKAGRT